MAATTNTVERAFELARSGNCPTLKDVVQDLKKEGFSNVEAHTAGHSIRATLRQLCLEARRNREGGGA